MTKKVKCPVCTNKRLLDMVSGRGAEFEIKCPRCASTIKVLFKDNQIITKKM